MSIGNVDKIDPAFLVEEELDFLIIGDDIENNNIPSPEIQGWLDRFSELCNKNKLVINSVSSYLVSSTEIHANNDWINFFRKYKFSLAFFPPVLQLKLKEGGFTLEKNAFKSVRDYSNKFIQFFLIFDI
ncbi:MAG: hypothetical protein EAX91_08240 [Candidatus Lokiarchaeota archaeon]|nr:hypothetical protein [Candidatus Lokiarchaeota archaeon]